MVREQFAGQYRERDAVLRLTGNTKDSRPVSMKLLKSQFQHTLVPSGVGAWRSPRGSKPLSEDVQSMRESSSCQTTSLV